MLSRMKGRKDLLKLLKQIRASTAWFQDEQGKTESLYAWITPNVACSHIPKKVIFPIQCSCLYFPHFKELEKAQIKSKNNRVENKNLYFNFVDKIPCLKFWGKVKEMVLAWENKVYGGYNFPS